MQLLDLFSGIGGFSLGLERAGMRTVAFCEIDPYCQRVLKKHWPHVPCYGDIRTLTAARLAADGIIAHLADADGGRQRWSLASDEIDGPIVQGNWPSRDDVGACSDKGIDAICGGFPCQDISVAGKGAGIGGERSGLWSEYRRLVGELRPRIVIVENVTALLGRGLSTVLGDLAALGYDAEWHCIPAAAVGAPHRRDRIWIVAYCDDQHERAGLCASNQAGRGRRRFANGDSPSNVANANGNNGQRRRRALQMGWGAIAREIANDGDTGSAQWRVEPDVGRVAHGIPARVDRLRALGNAVVPQIPELIGRAIMQKPLGNGH